MPFKPRVAWNYKLETYEDLEPSDLYVLMYPQSKDQRVDDPSYDGAVFLKVVRQYRFGGPPAGPILFLKFDSYAEAKMFVEILKKVDKLVIE
jgi:hypothetical protein